MTTEQLKLALGRKPFQPFTVHLADSTDVTVRHPEMAWLTQGGRTLFVNTQGEDVDIVDLLLVTRLSFGTNGHGKQRSTRKKH